ncbi:unnamed protein product [Fusarium graminearum]|uniref:Chromosome 3, complete genome n=2 Tax=Gibberella zeae TaxID=5518 RepID=A0A0E0SPG3_GIBZE|nr:hypothetical protein FG05_30050 [Fusarium graminearum]CAG2000550.1 unnamed protein product [Fusarium graminearum]CEF88326.1 unnamed protein product [Fusarium graminearum]CZS85063.1 unnamed protein product [Fusarium graminearum]VTO93189.1 unnamed protein product [Fusarium graminearum]
MSSQTSTKKDTVEIGNSKTLESSIPKPLKTPSAKEPAKKSAEPGCGWDGWGSQRRDRTDNGGDEDRLGSG